LNEVLRESGNPADAARIVTGKTAEAASP